MIIFIFYLFYFVNLFSRDLVTVSVASVPRREKLLEKTVASILPQTDILNVFLNNYEHIPDFLKHEKIHIAQSQDFEDFAVNSKFFCAEYVKLYHFIIDEDILYPKNYIEYCIDSI